MSRLDSMESVVELPEAKPEVVDPGHVTRKFNCATGGAVVDADSSMVRRYEFAIETSVGPSIFQRTKVRPPPPPCRPCHACSTIKVHCCKVLHSNQFGTSIPVLLRVAQGTPLMDRYRLPLPSLIASETGK